jgi:AcrR family transcriptional regulator
MDAAELVSGRDARRKAIIDVAREIFLNEGYAAASMAAIAAQVGGSKATLYNYFPSKESLFVAIVSAESESESAANPIAGTEEADVAFALRAMGMRFLNFTLTDRALRIHRLVIAESCRFPELGRAFYENGPKRMIDLLASWIRREAAAGRLQAADPDRAADHFLCLCKSPLYQRVLWNVAPSPAPEARRACVDAAVEVFLAAYGADGAR